MEEQQTNVQEEQQQEPQQEGTVLGNVHSESAPEGAPESYDFTGSLPEGMELDEKEATDFGALCRELNLTNEQANKLATYGFGYAQRGFDAYNEQRDAEINGWGDEAKKELGSKYNETLSLAGVGIEAVEKTVPGIREALNVTGAGNRIEFIRAFAMLGKLVQEDPGRDGGAKAAGNNSLAAFYDKSDFTKL